MRATNAKQKAINFSSRKPSVKRGKTAESSTSSEKVAGGGNLEDWCRDSGIIDIPGSVQIKHSPATSSRGIFATRDFRKGECCLTVPSSAFVSRENTLKVFGLKLGSDSLFEDKEKAALIAYYLYLKYEKNDSPYFQSLPSEIGCCDEYGEQEREALLASLPEFSAAQVSARSTVLADMFEDAKKDYLNKLFPKHNVSFADFMWARIQVTSRAMQLPDSSSTLVICPIIDFANHSYSNQNAVWEIVKGKDDDGVLAMKLILQQDCAKDSEVFISYEAKDQYQMLAIYGFCPLDNPNTYMQFMPSFFPNPDPNQEEGGQDFLFRMHLLSQLRGQKTFLIHKPSSLDLINFNLSNPTNGAFPNIYLAYLFVCLLPSIPQDLDLSGGEDSIISFLEDCRKREDYPVTCMFLYNYMIEEISDHLQELDDADKVYRDAKQKNCKRLGYIAIMRQSHREILQDIVSVLLLIRDEFAKSKSVKAYIVSQSAE